MGKGRAWFSANPERTAVLLGFAALAAIALVGSAVWGGSDKTPGSPPAAQAASSDRPGAPTVYSEIESSTNCVTLQRTFDRAADRNELEPAGSKFFKVTLSYMHESEKRMRAIGCY